MKPFLLQILKGLASFFVVSLGGTTMGLLWGITTAFITKFTDHVRGESQHNIGTTALSIDLFGLYALVPISDQAIF